MNAPPNAYRVEALAERWECSPAHIYSMIRKGDLRCFHLGKLIRIHRTEVERVEGCGLNSIEEDGTLSGAKAERQSVVPYVLGAGPKRNSA